MRRDKTTYGSPINPRMGEGRFQDALRRMRKRISEGLPLEWEDSTDIGNKYTSCTWGMCSEQKEQWPDKDDHTWPDEFIKSGRIAPRSMKKGQHCPLNDRSKQKDGNGCFYSCKIFGSKNKDLSRERALELYDLAISERTPKTTADDNESWED